MDDLLVIYRYGLRNRQLILEGCTDAAEIAAAGNSGGLLTSAGMGCETGYLKIHN